MARAVDPTLLVLLGLRLRGFGPSGAVAELAGLDVQCVRRTLAACEARGWAAHRDGHARGWSLTPAGRAEGERRLGAELDERGQRPAVLVAYERFLGHNAELLAICTAWQVREGTGANDHSDEAYDAVVIERLGAVHVAAGPTRAALAGALDRFGPYEARLGHALGRVRAGERNWFAGAGVASYHSVWFELHENLLATLGIDRSRERRGPDDQPGEH
ncbi:MAG: transcriptional regulator [Acidimicrobiia bacterium]|nr:transcriptional regulator [Acidimicrobiia bacterium]